MHKTVLILGGSGKIGSRASEAFWNAGWRVRVYNRKTDDMVAAAKGADVIVNGLNPPAYHDWERTIPAITAQVIAAAEASGAAVILPGNIYNYGEQPGLLDENTPWLAETRKGRVRIAMEESYKASGVQTIVLRAGNFIDPAGNGDVMSMLIMREAAKGKLSTPSDPETNLAYAYVPDWARAAVTLAENRAALSMFKDIPFPGHNFSIKDLQRIIARHTGRTLQITRFPWWFMTALSPFWELAREMREMRYLYAMPHRISGTKFEKLIPDFTPTDLVTVMLVGLPADIYPDQAMGDAAVDIGHERTRINNLPVG